MPHDSAACAHVISQTSNSAPPPTTNRLLRSTNNTLRIPPTATRHTVCSTPIMRRVRKSWRINGILMWSRGYCPLGNTPRMDARYWPPPSLANMEMTYLHSGEGGMLSLSMFSTISVYPNNSPGVAGGYSPEALWASWMFRREKIREPDPRPANIPKPWPIAAQAKRIRGEGEFVVIIYVQYNKLGLLRDKERRRMVEFKQISHDISLCELNSDAIKLLFS